MARSFEAFVDENDVDDVVLHIGDQAASPINWGVVAIFVLLGVAAVGTIAMATMFPDSAATFVSP